MYDEAPTNGATHHQRSWPNPINQDQIENIQDTAREINRQARAFIREHPAQTVLAAVAIGFIIGRLVRS